MRLLGRTLDALKPLVDTQTPISQEAMAYATNWVQLDNKKTMRDLKISFRPFEETLIETIRWLERENHITRAQAGQLSRHNAA